MRRGPETVKLWTFARMGHEVYTRPDDVEQWEFGRPQTQMLPYEQEVDEDGQRQYPASERLWTTMEGQPSVRVYQTPDTENTVQSVTLKSGLAALVDLSQIRALAAQWYGLLRAMSMGSLTTGDLREMGHPYGYGAGTALKGWARLRHPNKVPTQPKRHFKGVRGSVGNLDIVNLQSGRFLRGWRYSVLPHGQGVTLNFWNEAKSPPRKGDPGGKPYPWFLSHGTVRAQAHGPWNRVATELMPALLSTWRRITHQAYREAVAREQAAGEAL